MLITQAAAYINRLHTGMWILKYVRELQTFEQEIRLLEKNASDARRDEHVSNSVLATWRISFEHIHSEPPSAADLLSFMSFFNRQDIPAFLVRHCPDRGEDEEGKLKEADTQFKQMQDAFVEDVALSRDLSSLTVAVREDEFEMHSLAQFATRTWLPSTGTGERWWGRLVMAMAKANPVGEYDDQPVA
ncbi:hypothetical protein MMC28_001221 [Mycoblastus sanguinarius]|nr:hypothetical protein [Mycoblastus sanguinarius]